MSESDSDKYPGAVVTRLDSPASGKLMTCKDPFAGYRAEIDRLRAALVKIQEAPFSVEIMKGIAEEALSWRWDMPL